MRIRSIADVAAAARGRRLDRGLSQSELARSTGISRKWISQFEAGKATAEFALVMRVLETLALSIDLVEDLDETGTMPATATGRPSAGGPVDLDALLEEYRGE